MVKKLILILTLIFLSVPSMALADTLILKNGKKVEGKIIEQNSIFVKMDIKGIALTYFADEIDHIEGEKGVALPFQKPQESDPFSAFQQKKSQPPEKPKGSTSPKAVSPGQTGQGVSAAKQQLILTLIEVSGTKNNMVQVFDKITQQGSPEEKELFQTVLKVDEVINQLVPVYDKHFTEQELKELVAFYSSSTGRKMLQVMPAIMEDSIKASMLYFQNKLPSVVPNSSQER